VEIVRSSDFDAWLSGLRDRAARARIQVRIFRLAAGNPGDVKPVGEGMGEMRINYGPGYRVYFKQLGAIAIVLLAGGDKSTQAADIGQGEGDRKGVGVRSMAQTFARYDAADYLKTPEDMQALLEAAVEDGDPAVIIAALGAIARAQNMSRLARATGLTREGLYKALGPDSNPAFGTIAKVARALGYELTFRPVARPVIEPVPKPEAANLRPGPAGSRPRRSPRIHTP
jgi:putative addiction module killer protein/probable addiction module antidote protein